MQVLYQAMPVSSPQNPPAPKVLGRDLRDGTRKMLQVYLGAGVQFFGQKPLFLVGRNARLQKKTVYWTEGVVVVVV